MTKPWYPQPRDLLTRPRARMLSLEAVGALMIAWSLSDDDGTIQPDADVTARELLVFAVTQHAREAADLDPVPAHTRAVRAVEELIESARVVPMGDALALDGWVTLGGAVERPALATTGPDAPSPAPRRGGRPAKSGAPMTATERKRLSRNPGADVTKLGHETPADVTKLKGSCHETLSRNSLVGGRAAESGEIENAEKTEEKSTSGAREVSRNSPAPVTKLGHETPGCHETHVTKLPASFVTSALPSTEALSSFDPLDVLDRMRKASGDRLATNLHTSTVAGAFATLARDLIAREVTTPDGLVKAAAHAAHDPWVSNQGRLPLARLMANDGKILLDLIAGSTGCGACGSPMASGVFDRPAFLPRPKPEPLAVDRPVMDPAEAKVVVGDLAAQWRAERGRAPLGAGKVASNG